MMLGTAVSAGLLTAGVGLVLRRIYRDVAEMADEFIEGLGGIE